MDIRFINSENEIINASRLSIKVINNSLIGIDAEKNVVQIEEYESEEKAREKLSNIVDKIKEMHNWYVGITEQPNAILVDLREERENGESE